MTFVRRRTPIRRIGPKGQAWIDAKKKLQREFFDKGILTCELKFHGCFKYTMLSFAHRYKRTDPRCEHTFNHVLLACVPCHQKIENDEELTRKLFLKLRGDADP